MAGHDGLAQVLRSEWTKFWTVRAWVASLVLAAVLTAGVTLALANASGSNGALPDVVTWPGGVAVNNSFYFMHRTLAGNGDITVRVTSLADGAFPGLGEGTLAAQPWAKAGIILEDGTRAGSEYAAVMAAPGHGVRMQYDFSHDTAGLPGAVSVSSPRWLRLVRSGDTVTGYDSADGSHWTMIGSATLAGLGSSVQAGLFAASPWVSQNGTHAARAGSALARRPGTLQHRHRQRVHDLAQSRGKARRQHLRQARPRSVRQRQPPRSRRDQVPRVVAPSVMDWVLDARSRRLNAVPRWQRRWRPADAGGGPSGRAGRPAPAGRVLATRR
jgi:hypothetical protein